MLSSEVKSFRRFLFVGLTVVATDYMIYIASVSAGIGVDASKFLGFMAGATIAYFANKQWTFSSRQETSGALAKFVLVYAAALIANVLANGLLLAWLAGESIAIQIAFLGATGLSAVINYLGLSFFVFRRERGRRP